MFLFVGVTVLVLAMAAFYESDRVQLHTTTGLTVRSMKNLWVMGGIFVVLSALSACRIASGNDYWNYTYMFSLIAQGRHVSSEFSFNMLVRGMQLLCGEDNYLAVFGLFSVVTVFFFLKGICDQSDYVWGSLFLFLANGYYFSSFNSVRYYLVLAIALFSIRYLFREEYGKFLLWILVAAGFHKSVILVLPVYGIAYFIARMEWTKKRIAVGTALIVVLALSFVFGQDLYRKLIFTFYPYYENSMFDHVEYSITNIGRCAGTLVLGLLCGKTGLQGKRENKFYYLLNVGGLLLYTVGAFIPEISRVAYYLIVPQIFLIPNLLSSMEKGWKKTLFTSGVGIVFCAYFVLFLRSAYSVDVRILPYLNWIFN